MVKREDPDFVLLESEGIAAARNIAAFCAVPAIRHPHKLPEAPVFARPWADEVFGKVTGPVQQCPGDGPIVTKGLHPVTLRSRTAKSLKRLPEPARPHRSRPFPG